jgi:membrane-associated phospholipid phosphatase
MMRSLDKRIFLTMYNFAVKRKAVKWIVLLFAGLSEGFFFVAYGVGAVWLLFTEPLSTVRFLAVPFAALCLNTLLRKKIGRVRPFVALGVEPLLGHEQNGSCPSNHAASAVVISLAFWLIKPYIALALLVLAFFTGVSRVCSGVHYPFDVLLGWLIGSIFGVLGFCL